MLCSSALLLSCVHRRHANKLIWAACVVLFLLSGRAAGQSDAFSEPPGNSEGPSVDEDEELSCNRLPTPELILAMNETLTLETEGGRRCFPPLQELAICAIEDLGQPAGCPCSSGCSQVASQISSECVRMLRDTRCSLYASDPDIRQSSLDEEQMQAFILNCIPDGSSLYIPCDQNDSTTTDENGRCLVSKAVESLFESDIFRSLVSGDFSCFASLADFANCIPFIGVPSDCQCGETCRQVMAQLSRTCMAQITAARCESELPPDDLVMFTDFFENCVPELADLQSCEAATELLGSSGADSGDGDGGSGSSNAGLIAGVVCGVVAAGVLIAAVAVCRIRRRSSYARGAGPVKGSELTGRMEPEGVHVPEVYGLVKGVGRGLQSGKAPGFLAVVIDSGADEQSTEEPRKLVKDLEERAAHLSQDPQSTGFAHEAMLSLSRLQGVRRTSSSLDRTASGKPVHSSGKVQVGDVMLEITTPEESGSRPSAQLPGGSDAGGSLPDDEGATTADRGARGYSSKPSTVALITQLMPELPDVNMDVDVEKDINFKSAIGHGAFGSVYMGFWTARDGSRKAVAVKMMRPSAVSDVAQKKKLLRTFTSELNIMARIDHPNVVRCFGGCVRDDLACLLLEYMEGGSLDKYLYEVRANDRLSYMEVLCTAKQVSSALAYLHPLVVHADIKPGNILLDSAGTLKIADFGLSRIKLQTVLSQQIGGTMAYLAPEAMKQERVTEKCDIFSLGVLIWEVLVNDQPWKDVVNFQIMHKVCMEDARPPIPEATPRELRTLISCCWNKDPQLRPSAHEVFRKAHLLMAAAKARTSGRSNA